MAQRVITMLTDDLDGTELEKGKGETVSFSIDGQAYELDLSDRNAAALRRAFERYTAAARKVGGRASSGRGRRSGGSSAQRDPAQTKAIKEWAAANGHKVAERGRIPQAVVDAYETAHKS